jgi:hypothetical protein
MIGNRVVRSWERFDVETGVESRFGRLFVSDLGQCNLSGVRVVHSGVDTVRQLYRGVLNPDVYQRVVDVFESGFGECVEFAGHVWVVGSGGKSGYRYRLQNNDLGIIIFLRSWYAEAAVSGSHLKIEASPHWIEERDTETIQRDLNCLAAAFLTGLEPSGVAVHMCVDVQGWEPSEDFLSRLVTHARRLVDHRSANVHYINTGEIASSYNRGQSYLLGSPSSVQFAVYRKDVQAYSIDKIDYWRSIWRDALSDKMTKAYVEDAPVWRIELRFHHGVLADFGRGAASQMEYGFTVEAAKWLEFRGVSEHLQGLWRYGLNAFRLESEKVEGCQRHIDAVWQFLLEDVVFSAPMGDFMYKRVRKTPGDGNARNVMLAFGNLLSIYARHNFTPKQAMFYLKQSGMYDDLYNYLNNRANQRQVIFSEDQIQQIITKALLTRRLIGRAA